MLVRPARYEDVAELLEMGVRMHRESAYDFLPFDYQKMSQLATDYIDQPETKCLLVAENSGNIVGMFVGYLADYFFCNEVLACDMVLFVDREYRGGSAAVKLIRAFQNWASERGAREICLATSTNINAESVGRFYERMQFVHVGGIYKQRL